MNDNQTKLGVVLLNLGTPDEPSTAAIRRYLAEFLSDPRVVNLPRWLWLPFLYLVILPLRPKKIVRKYQAIWGKRDAPLRAITQALAQRTEKALASRHHSGQIMVRAAMTYGSPGVRTVIDEMADAGADRYLFIPLFPQYAGVTVGACYDQISRSFRDHVPPFRFLSAYHDHSNYIHALTKSIERYRRFRTDDTFLLFSFHGIPQANVANGDPYAKQCVRTAQLVAHHLGLAPHQWRLAYQSRFGPTQWLTPYTDETLKSLPPIGIKRVLVVCPGFATECLETLEEIKITNRDSFMNAGGEAFKYVKALNATAGHVNVMTDLVLAHQYPAEQPR